MRKTIVCAMLAMAGLTASAGAWARCDHSWDTAKDGSHCGSRSADDRAGGRGAK